MPNTLVIVPTFNERDNLSEVVERVRSLREPVDLLFVDDNSPDGTGALALHFAARDPSVHILARPEKKGLGRAYCAGFAWALRRDYRFVVCMDGDLSHDPADIPRLIAATTKSDAALGTRYLPGAGIVNWPFYRRWLSRGAAIYVRAITGLPLSDPTSGFKCFRRDALAALDWEAIRSNGYSFQIEVMHKLWRGGRKIVEVPILFTERVQNRSKMSADIVVEALCIAWRLRFQHGRD